MIDQEKISLTEADTASYDPSAQILKAAMAYVDPTIGKIMAVIAKSIELQHMIHYTTSEGVSACDFRNRSHSPEEVMRDLRKYCGTREREQLDRCLNMMNLLKMYEMYKNVSDFSDLSAVTSAMSSAKKDNTTASTEADDADTYLKKMQSMLTPEQIQLIRHINEQQNT